MIFRRRGPIMVDFTLFRVEDVCLRVELGKRCRASKHTTKERLDYHIPISLPLSRTVYTQILARQCSLISHLYSDPSQHFVYNRIGLELQLVRSLAVPQAEAGSQVAGKEFLVLDGGE